jgi:hypothetical protein
VNEATDLHRQAMELADEANLARLRGEADRARALLRDAFEKERQAAALVAAAVSLEPTRSVLHRSAATLALDCGEFREAERLVAIGLAGEPPAEIADELRSLIEQIHFERHLQLRGISLQPDEFQLSISGERVGHGVAESELFVTRVQDLEKLVYRTAERKLNRPYRDRGRPLGEVARGVEVFLSVPRAASFAVSFRLGYGEQLSLPGLSLAEVVIDELLECLRLFNDAQTDGIRARIQEPSYFRNFMALAKRVAPDGRAVRTVGLTALRRGTEKRLLLTTPKSAVPTIEPERPQEPGGTRVTVRGTLRFADARKETAGEIQIIDQQGQRHRILVPPGLMDDIVRPLWDYEVAVTGRRRAGKIVLEDIDRAGEENIV